jgi:hypothetical protein
MADAQPLPHEAQPLTVNLQILSPSPQVEAMRFPDLPASTTIGELKAKIRERIASRPSDERMRLIYHARFLSRDGDTLLEVFGEDVVCILAIGSIMMPVLDANDMGSRFGQATSRRCTWLYEKTLLPRWSQNQLLGHQFQCLEVAFLIQITFPIRRLTLHIQGAASSLPLAPSILQPSIWVFTQQPRTR